MQPTPEPEEEPSHPEKMPHDAEQEVDSESELFDQERKR